MLSNTAVPRYYGEFRDAVIAGQIPICETIEMQMHRVDEKIANPEFYYDDQAVEGFVSYCNNELTLTDGSDLKLLDSFKLWAEDIFGWYRFVEQVVPIPSEDGTRMRYVRKRIKKRLCNKQYLIAARGASVSKCGNSSGKPTPGRDELHQHLRSCVCGCPIGGYAENQNGAGCVSFCDVRGTGGNCYGVAVGAGGVSAYCGSRAARLPIG